MNSNQDPSPFNAELVFHLYDELFPSEFEFMVLYHLYLNYPSSEIQYSEIKQAIVDTSRLPFITTGKDRQVERSFKGLLRAFLERVPAKSNRFILTPHAERVVEIALQRINNPYLKFPLKETFETYFTMPENADADIGHLQSWFKFGFQNNARQVVTGHLEGLKLAVDDAIKALNRVLETDGLSAIQMLENFSSNFQLLGDKARQITEAIKMKIYVHYQLKAIVEKYMEDPTAVDYNEESIQRGRIALQIKAEVFAFFDKIDNQLDVINMKMAFASAKIAELQESLRSQSHYKMGLKKLLVYLLENSRFDQLQWITLPGQFPRRGLVQQKFRFRNIRYYDTGFLKRSVPFTQQADVAYEQSQRAEFEHELVKQALIAEHCDRLGQKLSAGEEINIGREIFDIIEHAGGMETSIHTAFEVIHQLREEYSLTIIEQLESTRDNNFHIWKTVIYPNQDLNS